MSVPSDDLLYTCFGLHIASETVLPLARVPAVRGDVTIVRRPGLRPSPDSAPHRLHRVHDYPGGPLLEVHRACDGAIFITYDVWIFRIDLAAGAIAFDSLERPPGTSFEIVIERIVLPLFVLFASPAVLGLHGSAVALDGRAWVFIGESGAGKSTTAHELLHDGAHLLADDMTLVDVERGLVLPGSPSVRLWQRAGEIALASYDRPLGEATTKRWFRIRDEYAHVEPLEIGAIFWLEALDDDHADGRIEPRRGGQGLVELLRQVFDLTDPEPMWMKRRFQNASTLYARVPLLRYRYARSADGAPTHVEALEHFIHSKARHAVST